MLQGQSAGAKMLTQHQKLKEEKKGKVKVQRGCMIFWKLMKVCAFIIALVLYNCTVIMIYTESAFWLVFHSTELYNMFVIILS